jgi:putative phosphoserine phosphatase/1-acylglycerol-3-phosphate O-acyltransferase
VNPGSELAEVAQREGWPVRRFGSRGRPSLTSVVRTAAAYGGMASGFGAGVGIGALTRNRRDAANITMSVGTDLALGLAGIHLNVTGEEHLTSHRPAVFIFNHQSSIDVAVIGSLVRRDVSGVAKKEAARDPRFALIGYIIDVAYIDRGDPKQARAALEPAVERLRNGTSIAIAPEGTRSPTPRLGRFKKGAFHLARQAGAPLVPIVIRNAGDVMWRGSLIIRPGTIDVAVLEPIPTEGWRAEEVGLRANEIRRRFAETLEHWPL